MSKKLWVVPHNVLTNCAALRARGVAVVLSNFIHQHSDHLAAPLGRGSTTICGAKTISWGILACGISNTWYLLRRQTTGTTGCCDGLEQVGELVSKDEEDEKPELGCIFEVINRLNTTCLKRGNKVLRIILMIFSSSEDILLKGWDRMMKNLDRHSSSSVFSQWMMSNTAVVALHCCDVKHTIFWQTDSLMLLSNETNPDELL